MTIAPTEANDPRARAIGDLDLSVRARRVVDMLKVKTLGELCQKFGHALARKDMDSVAEAVARMERERPESCCMASA